MDSEMSDKDYQDFAQAVMDECLNVIASHVHLDPSRDIESGNDMADRFTGLESATSLISLVEFWGKTNIVKIAQHICPDFVDLKNNLDKMDSINLDFLKGDFSDGDGDVQD